MLLFGRTPILVLDSQEFRRLAITNLFASLLSEKNVVLLQCDSVESLLATYPGDTLRQNPPPLFIFNAGPHGLMDHELTGAIRTLHAALPECPVLVMLETDWQGGIDEAMALGVNGVISMAMPPRSVVAAVEIALAGGTYYPKVPAPARKADDANGSRPASLPAATPPASSDRMVPPRVASEAAAFAIRERIAADDGMAAGSDPMQLSRRQTDVLRTLQSGMSNKEIARALGLSEATVKIHVRHLMRKFGVGNRTQVAVVSRYVPTPGTAASPILGPMASL